MNFRPDLSCSSFRVNRVTSRHCMSRLPLLGHKSIYYTLPPSPKAIAPKCSWSHRSSYYLFPSTANFFFYFFLFSTFLSLSNFPFQLFPFSSPVTSPISLFLSRFSSAAAVPRGYETVWETHCMCRCQGLSSLVEDPLMVLGIIHLVHWAVQHCHTAPAAASSHAHTDIHIQAHSWKVTTPIHSGIFTIDTLWCWKYCCYQDIVKLWCTVFYCMYLTLDLYIARKSSLCF